MYSRLFNLSTPIAMNSRFAQKPEAKKILEIIAQLQAKEKELQQTAENLGRNSLDYAKHEILAGLLKNIHQSIDRFNAVPANLDRVNELYALISLLRELAEHLKEINQNWNYKNTLLQFRNRSHIRNALHLGVWGTIGAAFTFVGNLVENGGNVNSPLPQTCVLLNQLLKLLDGTNRHLTLSLNFEQLNQDKNFLSYDDNMVCPISGELIEHPVLCRLDGYTYEQSCLHAWLVQYGTSPLTGKAMPANANIDDMMVINRVARDFNVKYKQRKLDHVEHRKESELSSPSMIMVLS